MPLTCQAMQWLLIVVALQGPAGRDHLVPDREALQDEYGVKLRTLFAEADRDEVMLQALFVPSFVKEFAVGVRPRPGTGEIEAFVLEPASSVWDTELVRMYETGEMKSYGRNGKQVPLGKNSNYLDLKKRTPSDYRNIKVIVKSRPLPPAMAKRLRTLWDAMLREVKPDDDDENGFDSDGETYHISARFQERGRVSGSVWSPSEETPKTWHITRLVHSLHDYASRLVPLDALSAVVERAERAILP